MTKIGTLFLDNPVLSYLGEKEESSQIWLIHILEDNYDSYD